MGVNIPMINRGVPPGGRADAARLYWEAFSQKLAPALGDSDRAVAFLARRLDTTRLLAAVDGSEVVGILGFHLHDTQAIAIRHTDLRTHYSPWSAWWRLALLAPLDRRPRPGELLLDGVCVTASARGAGIGTGLLNEAINLAQAEGATSVRLSVVDTNPRARALYERLGFRATATAHMGSLGHLYGFSTATEMVRPADLATTPR